MELLAKEKTRCSAESQDEAGPSCDTSPNWNTILSYDILRSIFNYLKVRDLSNAVMVSKFWKIAASDEYFSRGAYYSMRKYSEIKPDTKLFTDLYIKPHLGFIFVLYPNILKKIPYNYPSYCKIVGLSSTGIIDNNQVKYHINHNILLTILPYTSHVQIRTIEITKEMTCRRCLNQTLSQLPTVNRDTSTCCILFSSYTTHYELEYMFQLLNKRSEKHISSMWGGITDNVGLVNNSRWQESCAVVIFISGPIKTWSIIINSKCDTELINKKLKAFKMQITLTKRSTGFMFTTHTTAMYDKNVESIFKKVFPRVPLIGCFGKGIFGINTIDDLEEEIQEKQSNSKIHDLQTRSVGDTINDSWYHELSTVFMILSYD